MIFFLFPMQYVSEVFVFFCLGVSNDRKVKCSCLRAAGWLRYITYVATFGAYAASRGKADGNTSLESIAKRNVVCGQVSLIKYYLM